MPYFETIFGILRRFATFFETHFRKGDSVTAASVKSSPKTVCNTVKSYDSCDRFIYALKPNNLDVFSVSLKKENSVKIPANRTCLAPNPVDKSVLLGCGNSGEIHRVSLVNYSVKELTISKQPVAPIKAGLLQIAPLHASKNKVAILRGEALGANEAGILDITKGVVNTFPGFPSLYPTKALRCSPVTGKQVKFSVKIIVNNQLPIFAKN